MTSSVHATEELLFSVLLQLIVMIAAARAMHLVARRLGQPGAVGEIVAGLMLGPSLLGRISPEFSLSLFGPKPAESITVLSQVGLTLLMFQIGASFEFGHLKDRKYRRATGAVALASLLVPLGLGLAIGLASAGRLLSVSRAWRLRAGKRSGYAHLPGGCAMAMKTAADFDPDVLPKIKAQVLINYAGNDERVNASWPAYETALEAAGVNYQMFRYPGTEHGFNNDTTPRYHKEAAALAWSRTIALFNSALRT